MAVSKITILKANKENSYLVKLPRGVSHSDDPVMRVLRCDTTNKLTSNSIMKSIPFGTPAIIRLMTPM